MTLLAIETSCDETSAALVRDGDQVSGEYTVTEGADLEITHTPGEEFAVGRLAVPLNYEVSL